MNPMTRLIMASGCVIALAAAPIEAAFAQTATPPPPRSEIDKAIGRCVLAVGAGAIVGALFGGASRSRNGVAYGAGAGAMAGGIACAVMLKIQHDKQAILEHQQAAIAADQDQQVSFQGQDGLVSVSTQVRPVPQQQPTGTGADTPSRVCRYAHTTVDVSGTGQTTLPDQLYCRDEQGDWTLADANSLNKAAA